MDPCGHYRLVCLWVQVVALLLAQKVIGISVEIDVHRAIQWEDGGLQLGSRSSQLRGALSTVGNPNLRKSHILIITKEDLEKGTEEENLRLINDIKGSAGGIIFLPPPPYIVGNKTEDSLHCQDDVQEMSHLKNSLKAMERHIFREKINCALTVSWETTESKKFVSDLRSLEVQSKGRAASLFADQYYSKSWVDRSAPGHLTSTNQNFWGWLTAKRDDTLPTLAIVTHYDTLTSFPSLSMGSDSGSSGLLVALEAMRLLAPLYNERRAEARVNLFFLVTGAAGGNFRGLHHFLTTHEESTVLRQIQFALYLDSLNGNELHFHVSKSPKQDPAMTFLDNLKMRADEQRLPFSVDMKKVKTNDIEAPWGHELFLRHRIASGTLSHLTEATSFENRCSFLENDFTPEARRRLMTVTTTLVKSLVDLIWGKNADIDLEVEGAMKSSQGSFIEWQQLLSQTPRVYPFMTSKTHQAFYSKLHDEFAQYLAHTSEKSFPVFPTEREKQRLKAAFQQNPLSSSQADEAAHTALFTEWLLRRQYHPDPVLKLSIGRSKSVLLELTMLASVIVYLIVLDCTLFGGKNTIGNVFGFEGVWNSNLLTASRTPEISTPNVFPSPQAKKKKRN